MYKKLLEKINEYDVIIIHRHTRPDLDAIGSQVGLYYAILENFENKTVYMVGESSSKLSFLKEMDEIEDSVYENSLCIICDVCVSNLISDTRYSLAKEVIILDHHTNKPDINYSLAIIEDNRIACCELISDILIQNNLKLSKNSATALYGGIVTDSGRFLYQKTSDLTFSICSKLISSGADIQFIYENLYVETLEEKKLKNYFSNKFEVSEYGFAYMKNDVDVFSKFDVDYFTVSRGMISVMSGVKEIKIWANFTVDLKNNCIGCEFRSRDIKIVDIAVKYGGGGHDVACGASVKSWDVVDLIINDFNNLLKAL